MSTEQDRFKKSKRLLKDENAIKKQTKIAKEFGLPVKEPHKFAKQHAMDCGNPKCLICSREKVFGQPPIQQKRFDQNVEETRDKRSNGLTNQEEQ
ncbi:hypothetical protein N9972_00910 [bacterium]|nr:hypothetical protein [bacterium]